ncbi:MAG: hypothetical protein EAX86_04845 [Candidatus Heimdallarchaeota archaeon]|nr:hypothetical protein [Candidatus Heimdallarchaeota archaeon]
MILNQIISPLTGLLSCVKQLGLLFLFFLLANAQRICEEIVFSNAVSKRNKIITYYRNSRKLKIERKIRRILIVTGIGGD